MWGFVLQPQVQETQSPSFETAVVVVSTGLLLASAGLISYAIWSLNTTFLQGSGAARIAVGSMVAGVILMPLFLIGAFLLIPGLFLFIVALHRAGLVPRWLIPLAWAGFLSVLGIPIVNDDLAGWLVLFLSLLFSTLFGATWVALGSSIRHSLRT